MDISYLLIGAVVLIICIIVGIIVYQLRKPRFPDHLSHSSETNMYLCDFGSEDFQNVIIKNPIPGINMDDNGTVLQPKQKNRKKRK